MDVPLIAAVVTFLAILLASSTVFFYFNSREIVQTWRRRAEGGSVSAESEAAPAEAIDRVTAKIQDLLEWFGRMNQPSNAEEVRAVRRQLINAGYRSGKVPILFLGTKLLLAVIMVCLVAAIPVKLLGFPSGSQLTFYYVLAAACGYYVPSLWLRKAIAARKEALQRAIPDALDLMVVCVEAGLGLDQAMTRVGEEVKRTHPELSDELNLLALELRTGAVRQEALRNLAHRTDLEEVRNLVAMLVQTDRFGTSIGQALRVHADAMRTMRRLKAEEMAAKLPVKLLFPLIFFIFPSMFIVLLGSAAIQMIRVLLPTLNGH
jgi:tight adherence protein C